MRKLVLAGLVTSLLLLTACENSTVPRSNDHAPDLGVKEPADQDAELIIEDLNDHLQPRLRCAIHQPNLTTSYASTVPNQDAASCRFSNGTPLVVLIVRDGEATYERHFGGRRGPFYYLWGPTWIVIAPQLTPRAALEKLRDEFGAVG